MHQPDCRHDLETLMRTLMSLYNVIQLPDKDADDLSEIELHHMLISKVNRGKILDSLQKRAHQMKDFWECINENAHSFWKNALDITRGVTAKGEHLDKINKLKEHFLKSNDIFRIDNN